MELQATYLFAGSTEKIWDLMINPETVASCLPGCERLEPTGENTYKARLTLSVAAISGSYDGTVAIVDQEPHRAYRLVVDGKGQGGFVKGEARVELSEEGNQTRVSVTGQAQVGGLIARVGQRLLGSVSKMMMDRFFACLQKKVD